MKRNSNSRKYNTELYSSFDFTDTRYYGVFIRGEDESFHVLVDPKRYQKIFNISEDMKHIMDKRIDPLFRPAKKKILDYNINFIKLELKNIRCEWNETNKPMIARVLSEIRGKEYKPYNDDLAQSGVLYAFKGNTQESVRNLDGFAGYDKMYAIWNYIKHNSLSTFNEIKNNFPEVLKEDSYAHGDLACFFIDFTDSLIDSIIDNVTVFLKEYCQLVFNEDEFEARWNSEEHFLSVVREEIEAEQNPLGIPFWI